MTTEDSTPDGARKTATPETEQDDPSSSSVPAASSTDGDSAALQQTPREPPPYVSEQPSFALGPPPPYDEVQPPSYSPTDDLSTTATPASPSTGKTKCNCCRSLCTVEECLSCCLLHSIGTSAPAPDEGGATGAASEPSPGEEDALKGEAAPSPPQGHAAPDDERPPRSLTPPQAETVPASPKWPRPAPRGPPEPPSESATRQPPPYVAVQTDPLPLGPPPAYDEPGYDFPEQSFAEPTARGRRAVGTEERVGGAHGEDGQVSGTQCAGLCLTCCWLCFFLDSYVRDN